ncbi:MAG TPA: hypothetical protein VGZ22_05355 [Isosphaeraceae bacterium]|nr:hypothetical protein [Isosphaeraceae bacterium]
MRTSETECDRRAILVALVGISASLALLAPRGNVCGYDPANVGRTPSITRSGPAVNPAQIPGSR